jgi:hypothetical protein
MDGTPIGRGRKRIHKTQILQGVKNDLLASVFHFFLSTGSYNPSKTDMSTYIRWCIRTGIYLEEMNTYIRSCDDEKE